MKAWERLLIIIPAGLALGAVGGQLASPVLIQRGDDTALQTMFESRAQRYGRPASDPSLTDATYYSDSSSYPPNLEDTADNDGSITGWRGPDFAGWPDYTPAPMPTIAELKAEVAARDAIVGRQALNATAPPPSDEPADTLAAQGAGKAVTSGDDPQTADGDGRQDTPHPKIVIFSQAAATHVISHSEPPATDGTPAL